MGMNMFQGIFTICYLVTTHPPSRSSRKIRAISPILGSSSTNRTDIGVEVSGFRTRHLRGVLGVRELQGIIMFLWYWYFL